MKCGNNDRSPLDFFVNAIGAKVISFMDHASIIDWVFFLNKSLVMVIKSHLHSAGFEPTTSWLRNIPFDHLGTIKLIILFKNWCLILLLFYVMVERKPGKYILNQNELKLDSYCNYDAQLAKIIMWIMQALQNNLDGKSKNYKDQALTHLFMMNNIHYIVRSVRRSDAKDMLGDD
ncbi:putative exocyst complex component Exo70, cullin repeat-like-containing domain superfamily [Helianthus debilis subsp. tardiflorus]